jgi:poly-gamma-glutamate capsule biosynthesis protein CapA/YwtB (metallophosphatase superfamily)
MILWEYESGIVQKNGEFRLGEHVAANAPLAVFERKGANRSRLTIGALVKNPNNPLLAFVGNIMLGRNVDEQMDRRAPWSFWGTARPLLNDAAAVFANLECPLTNAVSPRTKELNGFACRARPQAVQALQAGNINCVSLANKHMFDYGVEGVIDTLRYLDANGIKRAGAGRNLSEAMAPAIVAAGGLRVAFTALTCCETEFVADADRPGVFSINIEDPSQWEPALEAAAGLVDEQSPDLRILSGHVGRKMATEPSKEFLEFTNAVLNYGFDIYFGHSAHVLQGVRTMGGKLIIHDAGDFLGDYEIDTVVHNNWSAVFQVEVFNGALQTLRISPVELSFARVDFAEGSTVDGIVERMFSQCEKLGAIAECDDEGLTVVITQG